MTGDPEWNGVGWRVGLARAFVVDMTGQAAGGGSSMGSGLCGPTSL
jgi:hypothetical protein